MDIGPNGGRVSKDMTKHRAELRFRVLKAASMKRVSSGFLRRVVWQKSADVSEVLAATIRTMSHLWNVGKLLPDYTAQQPRRQ
jgi:hypothetical protein